MKRPSEILLTPSSACEIRGPGDSYSVQLGEQVTCMPSGYAICSCSWQLHLRLGLSPCLCLGPTVYTSTLLLGPGLVAFSLPVSCAFWLCLVGVNLQSSLHLAYLNSVKLQVCLRPGVVQAWGVTA